MEGCAFPFGTIKRLNAPPTPTSGNVFFIRSLSGWGRWGGVQVYAFSTAETRICEVVTEGVLFIEVCLKVCPPPGKEPPALSS